MYSYGVVLCEIASRTKPYDEILKSEIAQHLSKAEFVKQVVTANLRPSFPSRSPPQFVSLAKLCWHADITVRPTFENIVQKLEELETLAKLAAKEGNEGAWAAQDDSSEVTALRQRVAALENEIRLLKTAASC